MAIRDRTSGLPGCLLLLGQAFSGSASPFISSPWQTRLPNLFPYLKNPPFPGKGRGCNPQSHLPAWSHPSIHRLCPLPTSPTLEEGGKRPLPTSPRLSPRAVLEGTRSAPIEPSTERQPRLSPALGPFKGPPSCGPAKAAQEVLQRPQATRTQGRGWSLFFAGFVLFSTKHNPGPWRTCSMAGKGQCFKALVN